MICIRKVKHPGRYGRRAASKEREHAGAVLKVLPGKNRSTNLHVLCIGAHSDDIEIGCGGTVLRLIEQYPKAVFHWVVLSADAVRGKEAADSARRFLQPARAQDITIRNFRDGFFPYAGAEIKEFFEAMKKRFSPDLIFTHTRNDLHQDHRVVSELTWNTYRDHLILEFEIPKYDGDLGSPNFFVHLDEAFCRRKIAYLLKGFSTQRANDWFCEETFSAIMRLRGIESNAPSKFAEAFYCRKIIL
jgi:LmbE family N-acetylglucosaminyl deacetylase